MLNQMRQALQAAQKGQQGQPGKPGQPSPEDAALSQMMQSPMMQQAMQMAARMRQVQNGQRPNNAQASTGNLNGGTSPGGTIKEEDLAKLTLEQRSILLKMQPQLREELLQGMREQGPEGYGPFIQNYFKRLTEVRDPTKP